MNCAVLRVLAAGPGITIQDRGRRGFLRFGVTESGPMDRLSHATANRAARVALDSAAIEVSLGGIELTVEGMPLTLSVAGEAFDVRRDNEKVPAACLVRMQPGQKLAVRAGSAGAWCYIATSGRFDLQPTLGSVSMHTRSSIGGSGVHAEDMLRVIPSELPALDTSEIVAPWLEARGAMIRVILGPQDAYFDPAQIKDLLNAKWTISNRCDRMAYLLEGPQIKHTAGFNIVSDGAAAGSIQIPGDGRPIVLMADRPPTGGYPKIATVIGADLGRLAQFRPGHEFQFQLSSLDEAVAARRHQTAMLEPPILLRPIRTVPQADALLRKNLVDGVTAGLDDAN